jgi:hypothetical protein
MQGAHVCFVSFFFVVGSGESALEINDLLLGSHAQVWTNSAKAPCSHRVVLSEKMSMLQT